MDDPVSDVREDLRRLTAQRRAHKLSALRFGQFVEQVSRVQRSCGFVVRRVVAVVGLLLGVVVPCIWSPHVWRCYEVNYTAVNRPVNTSMNRCG